MERSTFEASLSDEQIIELAGPLKDLTRGHEWATLVDLLRGSRIHAREAAFASMDPPGASLGSEMERFAWWKGYVAGLLRAETLPGEVVTQAGEMVINEEKRDVFRANAPRLADVESDPSS